MKIERNDLVALIGATMVAVLSLYVRDNTAQKALFVFFMAIGIAAGYMLSKHLGTRKWEMLLYGTVVVLSVLSLLLAWDSFTRGRWLVTPIVNLYIPGLFLMTLPLVVWLKNQRKLLLAACALGFLVLITLLMKSVDGLIFCIVLFAVLVWERKSARTIVMILGIALYVLMLWHHSGFTTPVETGMWQGMRAIGSTQPVSADVLFKTAVLEDFNYGGAEVLYRFGIIPFVALLVAFGLIISWVAKDRCRNHNRSLRQAFLTYLGVRIAVHFIGMGLLISKGMLVSVTALPFMGDGCSVFAEYAMLVWAMSIPYTNEHELVSVK